MKGRYLLGSSGVGLVSKNQNLKATWRWDRHACTSGSQVISPKNYVPYPKYYVPYPKYYVPILNTTYTATHSGGLAALPGWHVQGRESLLPRTSGTARAELYTQQVSQSSSSKKDRVGTLAVYGPAYTACLNMHLRSTWEMGQWQHRGKNMWRWCAHCWPAIQSQDCREIH